MSTFRERNDPVTWLLVFVLSIIAGCGAYLLEAATTTARECATGSGRSTTYEIGLAVLWLSVPILVGVRALRTAPTRAHAAIPVLVSVLIAPALIFLGAAIWWSGHNCMT